MTSYVITIFVLTFYIRVKKKRMEQEGTMISDLRIRNKRDCRLEQQDGRKQEYDLSSDVS